MKTVNLSLKDRAQAINMLPKTGNLDEIRKYKAFAKELNLTKDELKVQESLGQMHDTAKRSKAIDEFLSAVTPVQISDELYDFLHEYCTQMNEAHTISVDESVNLYEQFT